MQLPRNQIASRIRISGSRPYDFGPANHLSQLGMHPPSLPPSSPSTPAAATRGLHEHEHARTNGRSCLAASLQLHIALQMHAVSCAV